MRYDYADGSSNVYPTIQAWFGVEAAVSGLSFCHTHFFGNVINCDMRHKIVIYLSIIDTCFTDIIFYFSPQNESIIDTFNFSGKCIIDTVG